MAKSKRKGKTVPSNTLKPQRTVTTPPPANMQGGVVWFNFCNPNWLSSIRIKGFTNFLKDSSEFSENHFYIFRIVVPKVMVEWQEITRGGYQYAHCHRLTENGKEMAQDVYREIFKREIGDDVDLWQFGFGGSVRLVCIRDDINNSLIPIFIDHHHLIHASIKHNQNDYDRYSYCAVCMEAK